MRLIITASTIYGWLRVDGEEAELVHLCELATDDLHLRRGLLVAPWQGG